METLTSATLQSRRRTRYTPHAPYAQPPLASTINTPPENEQEIRHRDLGGHPTLNESRVWTLGTMCEVLSESRGQTPEGKPMIRVTQSIEVTAAAQEPRLTTDTAGNAFFADGAGTVIRWKPGY